MPLDALKIAVVCDDHIHGVLSEVEDSLIGFQQQLLFNASLAIDNVISHVGVVSGRRAQDQ